MNSAARIFRSKKIFQSLRKLQILTAQRQGMCTAADRDVVIEKLGNAGIITLNRPKALNALNLPMIHHIYPQLEEWDNDNEIKVIIMKGAGDKAFCAGGDVRAIAEAGKKGDPLTKTFFKEEYILNHKIGTLKTPFVALIDGITMGGGVGLSVHGKFRVATQKTLFAMPETAIGFFPDVGGGYFLPRLSGHLGTFLALTGHRLKGRDVCHAGVATHYVQSDMVQAIENKLLGMHVIDEQKVKEVLDSFHSEYNVTDEHFSLESHKEKIDRIFAANSLPEILNNLRQDGSEWSSKQIKVMEKMSPMSMCVTLQQLTRGANLSFADVFTMEYRISQKFMDGKDFYEGIRAVLIDKDNKPIWNPAAVDDVTQNEIDEYFKPLPESQDLIF